MPWPWKLARACLNLETGQVMQYPIAGAYHENEFILDCMNMVWRTWVLFNKPMSKTVGGKTITTWTPADIDFYDWLNKNAWTID